MKRDSLRGRMLALSTLLSFAIVCPTARAGWDYVGSAGFSAGNVINDGFDDFLIGAEQVEDSGHLDVVFINSSVLNSEDIIDDLPENAAVVYLTSGEDGVQELTDYLADKSSIDTIRIISHGNEGYFVLNGTLIDSQYLTAHPDRIASWGHALSEGGDILLYGCHIAASDHGKAFVENLADLTDADVAASTVDTGGLEANWHLDFHCGEIEAEQMTIHGYEYHLADQVVTNNNDSGPGSLRQALNDLGSGEEITFDADYTITLASRITIDKSLTMTGRGAQNTIVQANANPNTATYSVFAIDNGHTVNMSGITIRHGQTGCFNSGTLTMNDCAITGNRGEGVGGILNIAGGILTVNNSTISGNSATQTNAFSGGGIYTYGTTILTNCTIANNSIASEHFWSAGGVGKHNADLTMTNCTIANNTAVDGAGGYASVGTGTVYIKNSMIANNASTAGTTDDFYGTSSTTVNNSYNIIETQSSAVFSDGVDGCIVGDQANLFGTGQATQSLAANGGPTQTLALSAGSVAINAGNDTANNGVAVPSTDQRGATRPDATDIGAYEFNGALIDVPTVTTTAATLNGASGFDAGGNVTDDGGADVTARGVCWNTTGTPDIDNDDYTEDGTGTGEFTSEVTGVDESTHYYFRAYATNSEGTSYGEQKTIITGSTMPIAGYKWTERQPAGDANKGWYVAASSSDGTKLIAGVYGGRLYTSSDSGANWTERQPAGDADKDWRGAASSSDGTKLIVGVGGGRLYTSSDSGATWTERQPAGDANKGWDLVSSSSDGTKLIAGIYPGRLYTSSDSGANWTERQPAGDVDKNWDFADSSSDGTKLIAGIYPGRLYTSSDSGANWTERQPAGDVDKNWDFADSSSDGTKLIAGVYGGRLYTSSDSGANWTERQPAGNVDSNWATAASSSDGTKLIVGVYGGRLYTSSDSGANWTERQPAGNVDSNWATAASSSDGTKLIVGAYSGRLYTGEPPTAPTVTTTAVSEVTTTTATSGGNVTTDGGLSVTARGVCWSTSANPTTADDKTTDGTGTGAFTSSITGLSPGTNYHIRAYATNSEDTSYGNDVEFTAGIAVTTSDGSAAYAIGGDDGIVDPDVEIAASDITDFMVSITGNFSTGDVLAYTGALPGGVSGSYVGATGILSFSGTASAADWQTLLRTVTFSSSSASLDTRTIAFTAGGAIPHSGTEHFYEYVASTNINWSDARDAAAASALFGMQGYLATITSQLENDFIAQKLAADAWIGGSDEAVEDVWKWVTGPESGTQFSDDSTPVGGQFANWNTGEPNNSGGNEHYAEIYSSGGGKWNDLPDDPILDGYVVEYGGMAGDPSVQFTDTRDVSVTAPPTVTTTAVSEVTTTTATSGGNVTTDGGAAVTARGVCWSTSANPTTADSTTTDGTGTGVFISSITGLSANATYHVRAYATNSAGTAYGNDESFTTATPTVQFTAAAQSAAENVGTMTVTAELSVASGLDVTVPYTLGGTAADPADYTITASPVTITAGSLTADVTITVVNNTLDELDKTVIVTMGTPTNATKGTTDVHTATITDDDAPLTVATTAVSNIATTTADCGGNVTSDGGYDVTARGVCWSTLANPTTINDHTTDGTGTGAFTSTITGLSPDTTYYVAAYATHSVGTAYGDDVTFTTAAEETTPAPDTAPDLRVRIEAPAEDAYVNSEVTFSVSVENVGDGRATDVLLVVPLPENTEFVSAWWIASQTTQAAPLNASVEADEITMEIGDVIPGEDVQFELVLKTLVAGKVAVYASTTSEEIPTPTAAQTTAEVEVEDVEWIIIETITPIHACGVLGITPVFVLLGLVGLKRHGRTRSVEPPSPTSSP